jgi:DNA mismatch endonuclease (patch repair protein)
MQSVRRKGTQPENRIYEELLRRGLQLNTSTRPISEIRVTADLVFPSEKLSVFIDGCFWHRCPDHFKLPLTNRDWWEEKVSETVRRDRRQTAKLNDAGWSVVRVWEHENPSEAADRIVAALSP